MRARIVNEEILPFVQQARAHQHPGCVMVACHLSRTVLDRTINVALITSSTVNLRQLHRDVRKCLPRGTTLECKGNADDVVLGVGREDVPLMAHGHVHVLSVPMYANRVAKSVQRPAKCTQD
jgi:hypothetical protein